MAYSQENPWICKPGKPCHYPGCPCCHVEKYLCATCDADVLETKGVEDDEGNWFCDEKCEAEKLQTEEQSHRDPYGNPVWTVLYKGEPIGVVIIPDPDMPEEFEGWAEEYDYVHEECVKVRDDCAGGGREVEECAQKVLETWLSWKQ